MQAGLGGVSLGWMDVGIGTFDAFSFPLNLPTAMHSGILNRCCLALKCKLDARKPPTFHTSPVIAFLSLSRSHPSLLCLARSGCEWRLHVPATGVAHVNVNRIRELRQAYLAFTCSNAVAVYIVFCFIYSACRCIRSVTS